jgi:hypothetical protein
MTRAETIQMRPSLSIRKAMDLMRKLHWIDPNMQLGDLNTKSTLRIPKDTLNGK